VRRERGAHRGLDLRGVRERGRPRARREPGGQRDARGPEREDVAVAVEAQPDAVRRVAVPATLGAPHDDVERSARAARDDRRQLDPRRARGADEA
jgi:hypothetical protein